MPVLCQILQLDLLREASRNMREKFNNNFEKRKDGDDVYIYLSYNQYNLEAINTKSR